MRPAESFLLDTLRNGPRPAIEIEALARQRSVSHRTLTRARAALGVVSRKDGFTSGWLLSLPEKTSTSPEEGHGTEAGADL